MNLLDNGLPMPVPPRIHKVAATSTVALLRCVAPCLREEELRDAYTEIYRIMAATLLLLDAEGSSVLRAAEPSTN
jgi:hypothetical protein